MKKLLALLLALVMVFALVACGNTEEETNETEETTTTPAQTTEATEEETTEATEEVTEPEETVTVMTFEEYMAAELETAVVIECAVQGNQSWWDNKITVYGADENGGYFMYEMACSEEDAAMLTQGTWIRVTGVKKEWEGMTEIMDCTFEFIEKEAYVAEATDVTELLGTEEMINKTAMPAIFTGMTVESVEYQNGEPGKDIYLTVKHGEETYNFCVESYLTAPDSEVYTTVGALEAGTVIDITAFVYWYQGLNAHIISVTAVA